MPDRIDNAIMREAKDIFLERKKTCETYDHIDKTANKYSSNLLDTYLFLVDMLLRELVIEEHIFLLMNSNTCEAYIDMFDYYHIEDNEIVDMEMMHRIDHKQQINQEID